MGHYHAANRYPEMDSEMADKLSGFD